MADIHFERPYLDARNKPEQNIAILDRWAAELTNNLNFLMSQLNRETNDEKQNTN